MVWGQKLVLVYRQEHKPCLFIICPLPSTPPPRPIHSSWLTCSSLPPIQSPPPPSVHLHSFPVKQKSLPCIPNRKPLKGTVLWDRFQKFWQKFTELGLTKGRGWFLNFLWALKVVTNEKWGGLGSWQVFEDGFGPWRSMFVYFLMLPSSFLRSISVSCL